MGNNIDQQIPDDVAAVYDAYPPKGRKALLEVRTLILETAQQNPDIGPITETLKWGEPSYLTEATGSGSTIRLGCPKSAAFEPMMFFNCQTTLVEDFREMFSDALEFQGNRAVKLNIDCDENADILRTCILAALTYHFRKRRKQRS